MELVAIVVALALVEYVVFMLLCGQARGRFSVAAPSTHGHQTFERYFRVQANTVEQLVVFLPGILLFGVYVSPAWAAGLGLVFILGRALYARGYVIDPARRGPGFALTLLANGILVVGGLIGAIVHRL
jgi:glutathione S-transferase